MLEANVGKDKVKHPCKTCRRASAHGTLHVTIDVSSLIFGHRTAKSKCGFKLLISFSGSGTFKRE